MKLEGKLNDRVPGDGWKIPFVVKNLPTSNKTSKYSESVAKGGEKVRPLVAKTASDRKIPITT